MNTVITKLLPAWLSVKSNITWSSQIIPSTSTSWRSWPRWNRIPLPPDQSYTYSCPCFHNPAKYKWIIHHGNPLLCHFEFKKVTTLFFFCRNVGLGFLTNKNNFQLLVLGLKNTLILTQKVQFGEFTGYFSPNSQSGTQGVDSVFELVFHSLYLPHTGAHMFVCTRVHVVWRALGRKTNRT